MNCSHPDGAITDYIAQEPEGLGIRYAWRGACSSCQHGVVGVTVVGPSVNEDQLMAALTADLMTYLRCIASAAQDTRHGAQVTPCDGVNVQSQRSAASELIAVQ